jgi:hypothetical protein
LRDIRVLFRCKNREEWQIGGYLFEIWKDRFIENGYVRIEMVRWIIGQIMELKELFL